MASLQKSEFFVLSMMKKGKIKKGMTIDKLALMVGKGFSGVDKRFDGVDKRFDGMDKRLDGMDKKMAEMNFGLHRIEEAVMEDHRNRIEILESKVRELESIISK